MWDVFGDECSITWRLQTAPIENNMNTFFKALIVGAFLSAANQSIATSYKAPVAPSINAENALKLAKEFAVKDKKEIGEYYVNRIWLQFDKDDNPRFWVVSWARPGSGYYFALVTMDGNVRRALQADVIEEEKPRYKIFLPE